MVNGGGSWLIALGRCSEMEQKKSTAQFRDLQTPNKKNKPETAAIFQDGGAHETT